MRTPETTITGRRLGTSAIKSTVARYVIAVAIGNLLWEVFQLPLFTLWQTARPGYLAFAVFHCWVGDLLITLFSLGLGVLAVGRSWPSRDYLQVAIVTLLLGLAYTVFSEWLNVEVRGSWGYASAMPRVPPLGTGLSPLLQWVVVPLVAFTWARPSIAPTGRPRP